MRKFAGSLFSHGKPQGTRSKRVAIADAAGGAKTGA